MVAKHSENSKDEKMFQIFALVYLRLASARSPDTFPNGLKEDFLKATKNETEREAARRAFESVLNWWSKRTEDFPQFSAVSESLPEVL